MTISGTELPAGELVRVDGKQGQTFTITAPLLSLNLTGPAPARSVDEPLCASIEARLLGNQFLRWGQGQSGWRARGRANQGFELRGYEDKPAVTVAEGEAITIGQGDSADTYGVVKADQFGFVPVASIAMILDRPPYTAPLELLCYEMPAYAADLTGLGPGFMRTANEMTCSGTGGAASGLAYWATALGAALAGPEIDSSQFGTLALQRGDLVQFYGDHHGYMHTAVATGDGEDVYSLWNVPVDYTVRVTLSTLWDRGRAHEPRFVRSAVPAWHRP